MCGDALVQNTCTIFYSHMYCTCLHACANITTRMHNDGSEVHNNDFAKHTLLHVFAKHTQAAFLDTHIYVYTGACKIFVVSCTVMYEAN